MKHILKKLLSFLTANDENALKQELLNSNVVSTQMKFILMTGIYTATLQNKETDDWAKKIEGCRCSGS